MKIFLLEELEFSKKKIIFFIQFKKLNLIKSMIMNLLKFKITTGY